MQVYIIVIKIIEYMIVLKQKLNTDFPNYLSNISLFYSIKCIKF